MMTNKKLVSPYANGEGLSTLPYGKTTSPRFLSSSSVVSNEAMQIIGGFSLCLDAAGWKLSPMMGAMYGPELYAGEMFGPVQTKVHLSDLRRRPFLDVQYCLLVFSYYVIIDLQRHNQNHSSNRKHMYRGLHPDVFLMSRMRGSNR